MDQTPQKYGEQGTIVPAPTTRPNEENAKGIGSDGLDAWKLEKLLTLFGKQYTDKKVRFS
jgi:hypothetical protein